MTVAQVGNMLLRTALIIYATRALGVVEWGVFSYTLGIASILTIFSDLGMTSFVTRELSKSTQDAGKYFATAFFVKIGIFAVGSIGTIYMSQFLLLGSPVSNLLPFLLLVIILDGLRDLINVLARSFEKFQIETASTVSTALLTMLAGILLISSEQTGASLTYAYIVGGSIGLLVLFLIFFRYFNIHNFSFSLVKPMIINSLPLGLAGLTGAAMLYTNIIIAGFFLTMRDVGIYSAAYKIIHILSIIPGFLAVPLFPVISRFSSQNNQLENLLTKGIHVVLLLAIPITFGGIAAAQSIILFLYGTEYASAVLPFQILGLTVMFLFPSTILGGGLFAEKKVKHLIIYSLVGIGSNILFNIILLPAFGIIGIAFSTLFAQMMLFLYLTIIFKKLINVSWIISRLWKTSVASFVMVAYILITQYMSARPVTVIGGAFILYLGLLIMLKEKTLHEILSIIRDTTPPSSKEAGL